MPRYIKLSETKSTNSYLAGTASALPGGTVIYTYHQTAGRGQKGNSWESEDNKNLAFSYLLKSPHIEPSRQFFISEADIYYRDQKICGILIENTLSGSHIGHSIIGVGININQERFVSDAPNPVSLKNITGDDYDLEQLLREVNERIERLTDFSQADEEALRQLHARYISRLYRADGKAHQWQLPTGECFEGVIVDVHPDGLLSIRHTATGEIGKYYFKEVKHVINKHVL